MISHTFTGEDFEKFEKHVCKYLEKLQITGWNIQIRHEQIGNGTSADISYNIVSQHACFRLTQTVEYDYPVLQDPKALAKHEVLHLLLATLIWTAARTDDHCADDIVAHEHNVINRLMEVM